MSGQHQQSRRNEFLASLTDTGEPCARERTGAFDADVIAILSHLAKVINKRSQFGSSRSEQCFADEFGAQDLIFG
jgi:hypothetical protein